MSHLRENCSAAWRHSQLHKIYPLINGSHVWYAQLVSNSLTELKPSLLGETSLVFKSDEGYSDITSFLAVGKADTMEDLL